MGTQKTRTLAAAQIAGALLAAQKDRSAAGIREAAEKAVEIAKAVGEAVGRSLKGEPPDDPPQRPSVPVGKL